jgi:DNA polymerase (family 10)
VIEVDNNQIAEVFERIASLLEIRGDAIYRVLAYRRASESIRSLSRELVDVWKEDGLQEIPGVGKAIAEKIQELLTTGRLEFYERLTSEIPETLFDLLKVPDVGPKKVALFWKALDITNLEELEMAARSGQLQTLPGVGERSEARILRNIEGLKSRETDRISIGVACPMAETFLQRLRQSPHVVEAQVGGSLRRWRETIGDLDLVVAATDTVSVLAEFLAFPEIEIVRGQGETKASVELKDGMRVQLWVHKPEHFGSALQYATGSQAHNVRLRELALEKGLSLSEYGFKRDNGDEILCPQETMVYQKLGIPWIPPEMREDRGEIRAALDGELPDLIVEEDIRGELHAHSDWSDGQASMMEMAEGAIRRGLSYLVISDHSRSLGVANGLSIERLRDQKIAIDELQDKLGGRIRLLHGTEVEILADGSLDFPDKVLEELDFVIASVHSSLRQTREQITDRFLTAIRNPHVDLIGHLSGRLIGRREPSDLDVERILRTAAEYKVGLEINAHPDRLDLNDVHARRAIELGCQLAITTDAHHPDHLSLLKYGVGTARRAWVTSESVINAWDSERFMQWVALRG